MVARGSMALAIALALMLASCTLAQPGTGAGNGEAACQVQGRGEGTQPVELTQTECEAVGCCQWNQDTDDGQGACWSSVGKDVCSQQATAEDEVQQPAMEGDWIINVAGPIGLILGVALAFSCFCFVVNLCSRFCEGESDRANDFKGQVFLAPAPMDELHINIGGITKNKEPYPEWKPLFQEAISEQDFNLLIERIKECREKNNVSACLKEFALSQAIFPWGWVASFFLVKQVQRITHDLDNIAKDFNGARVNYVSIDRLTLKGSPWCMCCAGVAESLSSEPPEAFDQAGHHNRLSVLKHPAERTDGLVIGGDRIIDIDRERYKWGRTIWPLYGYNVVLKAPTSLRKVWPQPGSSTPTPSRASSA